MKGEEGPGTGGEIGPSRLDGAASVVTERMEDGQNVVTEGGVDGVGCESKTLVDNGDNLDPTVNQEAEIHQENITKGGMVVHCRWKSDGRSKSKVEKGVMTEYCDHEVLFCQTVS